MAFGNSALSLLTILQVYKLRLVHILHKSTNSTISSAYTHHNKSTILVITTSRERAVPRTNNTTITWVLPQRYHNNMYTNNFIYNNQCMHKSFYNNPRHFDSSIDPLNYNNVLYTHNTTTTFTPRYYNKTETNSSNSACVCTHQILILSQRDTSSYQYHILSTTVNKHRCQLPNLYIDLVLVQKHPQYLKLHFCYQRNTMQYTEPAKEQIVV